ncbi:Kynurenine/alpha-aminoadipate aminotransferase, mitochondrial [Frankliniella fusca]|uniref:Kynurenine/alpha-aminoadipate aminotransferase, mitochondrial n=1 Tax=Frankliniella fusca TaxID=407009 RepID=A0AAE1LS45_9NEOP|nr:Kynurenine/alpha-aminoadipate aminotransferase, mitochondrial [Frankliniella fusca]KAK3911133.1 Kynurenine/alpha-aminoadipate aminotransferase, mitochondrial [Frankliniella fusca]KAK3920756.1 Kynurenine/alpha-aminoadipate aminotransferase, mitochondrial [Frankliniella fusca]KAK3928342.1 Kynurenine/alpha-aminoadipate aminotransferase, mitochondrial [Frankliniella fusca]KAK3932343.1 Kynurenine/alpha-aminoadipate aminotransferase, mitochondrial [Frankliniella fusca]
MVLLSWWFLQFGRGCELIRIPQIKVAEKGVQCGDGPYYFIQNVRPWYPC